MDSVFDSQIQDILNLKNSASKLFKERKYEEAITVFEKTLSEVAKSEHLKNQDREFPELVEIDAICILYIARSFMHLKKYNDAIVRLKQLLEIDSENSYALYKLGKCCFVLGNDADAKCYIQQALTHLAGENCSEQEASMHKHAIEILKNIESIEDRTHKLMQKQKNTQRH